MKAMSKLTAIIIAILITSTACSTDSLPDYTLTIEITPQGAGTTDPLPGSFSEGANLQLEAIPTENYLFDRWEGDLATESNPADLTMNSDKVITAVFKREPLTMGGDGSQSNPYQVHTLDDLAAIGLEENLDKHFIQVSDIDASKTIDPAEGQRFMGIGDEEHPFAGSYDGNGYTINNIVLNISTVKLHNGLFGYVKEGILSNVRIVNNVDLSKTTDLFTVGKAQTESNEFNILTKNDILQRSALGFLVGFNDGGYIDNCSVQAIVGGESRAVGGLVGINTGTIESSEFTGIVSSLNVGAGLVGINTGNIVDSSTDGRASGQTSAGLVGYNMNGEIINSFTTANVRSGFTVGGLVAHNSGQIISSFSKENKIFDSTGVIGGLVGQNEGDIENSYTLTDISIFLDQVLDIVSGGLVGENMSGGSVTNSFSAVTFDAPDEGTTAGLTGSNEGLLIDSYWDTETTGKSEGVGNGSPEGATGLTTAQMYGPAAEQSMPGFDWVSIWRTTEDGYPVLRWEEDN